MFSHCVRARTVVYYDHVYTLFAVFFSLRQLGIDQKRHGKTRRVGLKLACVLHGNGEEIPLSVAGYASTI